MAEAENAIEEMEMSELLLAAFGGFCLGFGLGVWLWYMYTEGGWRR